MRFLADESCDHTVVRALRAAGHDVSVVSDTHAGAGDADVLVTARQQNRIVLTEDKDFGVLAYAGGLETAGVILIRFPADARASLGPSAVDVVGRLGDRLIGGFLVLEPGRARLSQPPRRRELE
jgi:hypothetical protein